MSRRDRNSRLGRFEKLEERVVFSTTYFVDPVNGSEDHDGLAPASAVRGIERFVSQYDSLKPDGHVDLGPGDTIVLMPGEHNFAYRYGEGQWQGLFLRNVHGTASQPITIRGMDGARIDNRAPDGSEMSSIYVLQSSHIVIENLDVSSYGSAITVADATDVVVRNNYIHDVNGIAANNLSGVYLVGVRNVVVENNLLTDNYDRSRLGNANNRHIVIFGGVDVKVLGNTMRNSDPQAGMAVDYKHLGGLTVDQVGSYEVAYNTIINSAGTAIGTSAPNSYIHHNLLIDSGSIRVADFGGTNQLANERIEYNTIVNNLERLDGGGLSYFPNEYAGYPLGDLYWSHNLVVDNRSYDHPEKATIFVDRYGSDEFYRRVFTGGLFHAESNVYQTRNGTKFDLYGASGGSYGDLGSDLSFAQWQAAGFDLSGTSSSIAIDANYQSTTAHPETAGMYAGQDARLVLIVDALDINEAGQGSATKLRIVRTGSNSQPLNVTLSVSVSDEIKLARQVTIPAGEDFVEVTIEGIADSKLDPTKAIQIEAASVGFQAATTWIKLHNSASSTIPSDPNNPAVPPSAEPAPGVFQVPGATGETVCLQAGVTYRGAEYNNAMGVAYVDDASGRVGELMPGDNGWLAALMGREQHAIVLQSGVVAGEMGQMELEAGRYFVFFLVQDSTLENWQATNPANDLTQGPQLFTSVQSGNQDRFDHVRESVSAAAIDLAWEDLNFGGDQNFTDLVVKSTLAIIQPIMNRDDGLLQVCTMTTEGCECRPVTPPKQWTNPESPSDVNGDGVVSPLDLLIVFDALNKHQQIDLVDHPTDDTRDLAMIDTNGDRSLDIGDAYVVFIDLLAKLRPR